MTISLLVFSNFDFRRQTMSIIKTAEEIYEFNIYLKGVFGFAENQEKKQLA